MVTKFNMKFEEKKASCSQHIIDYRIACEECQEKSKYMTDFLTAEQEQNRIEQKRYNKSK